MFTIRDPTDADRIGDPVLRSLVRQRLAEVLDGEPYDPGVHGEMIVADPGDTAAALEEASGCPIFANPFDDSRYGNPDFVPVCETIQEHPSCYEVVFIFTDDGAGVTLFVPRQPGIDADLLALCAQFAEPTLIP